MTDVDRAAQLVRDAFADVDAHAFGRGTTANPRLRIEVVDPGLADDTPTLALVTPWALYGLAFPPDDAFPDELVVAGTRRIVFDNEIEGIGGFRTVSLASDVTRLPSQAHGRKVARAMGAEFRAAVAGARGDDLAGRSRLPLGPERPRRG